MISPAPATAAMAAVRLSDSLNEDVFEKCIHYSRVLLIITLSLLLVTQSLLPITYSLLPITTSIL